MNSNNTIALPMNIRPYTLAITALLLWTAFFSTSAIAQNNRPGRERTATVREGGREAGGRSNTIRDQPSRIQRNPDVAINCGNPGRDVHRNPAATERNPSPRSNYNRGNISRNHYGAGNANRPGYNNRPVTGSLNRPGYRPVYNYNIRPVYNPRNPSWRYGYLPRRNSYFYGLPSTYLSLNFGGIGYRYWNGVFYRPYNNLFTVIAPPAGIFINVLPVGYSRIRVRNYPYYYYNGTYYDQRGSNYYVVSPPVGAIVESLPAGYETVVVDGETFYTADGAQYKPAVQENGEIGYEVIKAN